MICNVKPKSYLKGQNIDITFIDIVLDKEYTYKTDLI